MGEATVISARPDLSASCIPNEIERLKQNVEMQQRTRRECEFDRSQTNFKELEPDWTVDEVELAAYEPDSGYGDGAGVANDFLARAARSGRVLLALEDPGDWDSRRKGSRVRGVATDQGEIAAPVVIAATGPWTRPLFQQIGFDLPIETEYHQVAILKNAPDMKGGGCACIDSVSATYFRSDGPDKFLVGDFYGKRPVDPDNFPQRASDESSKKSLSVPAAVCPNSKTRRSCAESPAFTT